MRRVALSLLLTAALASAAPGQIPATPPAAATPEAPPIQFADTPQQAQTRRELQALFGPGTVVRDFAPFTTERGEPAMLVLYVTDAVPPPPEQRLAELDSCPDEFAGIPLIGIYHVALVIGRRLINTVVIPSATELASWPYSEPVNYFPLRNTALYNYYEWGQGTPVTYDSAAGKRVEETKLIKLEDYNGDGHAWEFRLAAYGGACGHVDTLLAGYSARRHRVILYGVIQGAKRMYWYYNNLFPRPITAHPGGRVLHYQSGCDHGATVNIFRDFVYVPDREAWVMTRQWKRNCDYGPAPSS